LLLREVASAHSLFEDFPRCFFDARDQRYTEHTVQELVSRRVYGICLGYEDLNDHDRLHLGPLFAAVCGKEDAEGERRRAERDKGKALAGKSTLQRLETAGDMVGNGERYKKVLYDGGAIEGYFVDVFLKTYGEEPQEIILDVDATDDPIHGGQEGRFSVVCKAACVEY
jgi:hypothetical protein